MSINTPIQWTDDTVNHVMGCTVRCELRPTPAQARAVTMKFFAESYPDVPAAKIKTVLDGVLNGCNATEIYQLREVSVDAIRQAFGEAASKSAVMKENYKAALDYIYFCYAHDQTMMRGSDVTNPHKRTNPGYPVQFEIPKKFPGRIAAAAMRPDLYGKTRPAKPWLDYLPRVFFISDMGDSLSEEIDFAYHKQEVIDVVTTARGRQHIWLWLTKNPNRMAEFAAWLKSEHGLDWPDNLVAMTSVTSSKTVVRAEQLLKVPARFRGLSIEPLWSDVLLDLTGISWCIVGGQSGNGSRPFDVAWIESVRAQCKKVGAAFFVKQLGACPVSEGTPIVLKDEHGGNWDEWDPKFRIREMPQGFWDLRKGL